MGLLVWISDERRRNRESVQVRVGSECKGSKEDENNGRERDVDRSLRDERHRGSTFIG